MADEPYLTIIFTGRNDDFGGNFNRRFFNAVEFDHAHLRAAGVPHDFILVEWRPIAGKPYLATVLADHFRGRLDGLLTSYVVDTRYHDAFSLNPRLQFQEFIAKNVGIRRARGQYLLTTNTDIYLGRGVIDVLGRRALEPGVLYRAERIDLKAACENEDMDWDVLEDERNYEAINTMTPPWYTNASGDFLLLDRNGYHQLRGFNEVYRVAKVHMDSNFCVKAYSAGLPIVDLGVPVYHVGLGTLNSQRGAYRERPQDAPWGDTRWNRDVIYDNGESWGLADAPIRELDATTYYLEFDWAAVAPMVQLKRVTSPVARQRPDHKEVSC